MSTRIICKRPEVLTIYFCGHCNKEHDSYSDARDCRCPNDVFELYRCPHCKKQYSEQNEAQDCAYACLMLMPQPIPQCEDCGADVDVMKDIEDSNIIGSVLRCRECIARLAPELQCG
jgi:DNA-directed RNA polymerase subunit RPC12/RpoP